MYNRYNEFSSYEHLAIYNLGEMTINNRYNKFSSEDLAIYSLATFSQQIKRKDISTTTTTQTIQIKHKDISTTTQTIQIKRKDISTMQTIQTKRIRTEPSFDGFCYIVPKNKEIIKYIFNNIIKKGVIKSVVKRIIDLYLRDDNNNHIQIFINSRFLFVYFPNREYVAKNYMMCTGQSNTCSYFSNDLHKMNFIKFTGVINMKNQNIYVVYSKAVICRNFEFESKIDDEHLAKLLLI
jgi:hypothetical protein